MGLRRKFDEKMKGNSKLFITEAMLGFCAFVCFANHLVYNFTVATLLR